MALLTDIGHACCQGCSLRNRNGELLGIRSAGIGLDGDEERPLEQRRRWFCLYERGAAGVLEGGLGAANRNSGRPPRFYKPCGLGRGG